MITLIKINQIGGNRPTLELVGLSTDTKPTVKIEDVIITNGSTLFCMDTSDGYMFDEENRKWHKI